MKKLIYNNKACQVNFDENLELYGVLPEEIHVDTIQYAIKKYILDNPTKYKNIIDTSVAKRLGKKLGKKNNIFLTINKEDLDLPFSVKINCYINDIGLWIKKITWD